MIKIRYIDTSAFVKYYGKPEFEKGSEKVKNMVDEARKGESILNTIAPIRRKSGHILVRGS